MCMKKATQKQDLDPIALFLPAASSTSYSTGQEKQKKNIFLQKKKREHRMVILWL